MGTVVSNVTNGNDCHSLVALYREQALDGFNVVITYPARAKSTVSSCKAEVFNGNAKVDVAMILLSSVRTQASFRLLKHSTNIGTLANHGRL